MNLAAVVIGSLSKMIKEEIDKGERAASSGMATATEGLKGELRDQITGAGLGKRLANTWRSKTYPADRKSLKPAGFIWSKAPEIVSAHAEGATIRAHRTRFLAIPLPAAGKRTGRGKITPADWERAHGQRLQFIYRRRGNSLLVATNARLTKAGKAVARKAKGAAKYSVPIFVLVPQVTLRRRMDIDHAVDKWGGKIPSLVAAGWR